MAEHTKSMLGGGLWAVPLRWQVMLWWIQASTLGWVAVVAAGAFWSWLWVRCRIRVHRSPRMVSPQSLSQRGMRMRALVLWVVLVACGVVVSGCSATTQIRVENVSKLDFIDVSIGDQSFGDVPAGETSEYKSVKLSFGSYAIIKLAADGHRVTAQTLNMGAERFTHRIDVANLDAGHLDIEVVRE